ncbi:ABC transporter ATP-binding protein [Thalassobaculum sp. OXR-137]|uniref:ABC transporter ATP-binding protein n=1 Tax=Thalassobaculum sp. OXR-137 TaxID=3100173 RepID=UPI002AC9EAEE|nr:ABC transporter ATP-binding protein [Thalassobaculum sp. OXR-137]WPZ32362.1 ABC transporter ATP-binding protein [Thalassobaculum sp. OXR-137]
MTRLSLSAVSVAYGRQRVVHDISIPPVEDGQLLGLLGPNASGKSTLLRALSREHPAEGRILLDDRPIQSFSHADWYRSVAAMPQAPPAGSALRPVELVWSTARTLDLGLSDRALGDRIDGLFHALGLEAIAMAPLSTLSGGKRQLVGFALAMIRDPDVLLLDEPTSALDLYWRLSLMDIVRNRLATRGGVGVIAVHDLDLAARYCDRLALIQHGRLVAAGTAADVLTEANLAAVYGVEAEVTRDPSGRPDVRVLRVAGNPG